MTRRNVNQANQLIATDFSHNQLTSTSASKSIDAVNKSNNNDNNTATTATLTYSTILVLIGCCINVLSLELLTRHDPSCGALITLCQFILVALQGLIQHYYHHCIQNKQSITNAIYTLIHPIVPLRYYLKLTFLFFTMSLLNNLVFRFKCITVPIHTVFRSSSLIASLLLGYYIESKQYTLKQILSCCCVMLGVGLLTWSDYMMIQQSTNQHQYHSSKLLSSSDNQANHASISSSSSLHSNLFNSSSSSSIFINLQSISSCCSITSLHEYFNIISLYILSFTSQDIEWPLGLCILFSVLFLAAYLGICQSRVYALYGRHHWREVLLYTHLLALPMFTPALYDVMQHTQLWLNMSNIVLTLPDEFVRVLPFTTISLSMWSILAVNLISQVTCVSGVHLFASQCQPLTVTLVITLRKCVSLLLSVWLFQNPFSRWHWCGAAAVFIGAAAYSSPAQPSDTSKQAKQLSRESAVNKKLH